MMRLEKLCNSDDAGGTYIVIGNSRVLVRVAVSNMVEVYPFEFVCSDSLTFTTFFYIESKLQQKKINRIVQPKDIADITVNWKQTVNAERVAICINKIRERLKHPGCYVELEDSSEHVLSTSINPNLNIESSSTSNVFYVHKCAAEEIIHKWSEYLNNEELLTDRTEPGNVKNPQSPLPIFLKTNSHTDGVVEVVANPGNMDNITSLFSESERFELSLRLGVRQKPCHTVDVYHCLNGNMTITGFFYIYHCLPEGVPFVDTVKDIVSHFPYHMELGNTDMQYVSDIFCKIRSCEYDYIRLIDDTIFKKNEIFHVSRDMVEIISDLWLKKQEYVTLLQQNVYNWTTTTNNPLTKQTKQKHSATDRYGRNVSAPNIHVAPAPEIEQVDLDDTIHVPNAVHLSRHNDVKMSMNLEIGSHCATFCIMQLEHAENISSIGSDRRKTGWHLEFDRAKMIETLLSRSSSARNNRALSFANREQIFQTGTMFVHSNDDQNGQPYLDLKIYNDKKRRIRNEKLGMGSLTPIVEQWEGARINSDTLTWDTVEDTDIERVALFVRSPGRSIGMWVCYYRVPFSTLQAGRVSVAIRLRNTCHTVSFLRGNILAECPNNSAVVPTDIMTGEWAKKILLFHRQHLKNTFFIERDALLRDKAAQAVIEFEGSPFDDPKLRNLIQHVTQQNRGWRTPGRNQTTVSVEPGTFLTLENGTVVFECLSKGERSISWVTCSDVPFGRQALRYGNDTLNIKQIRYYPRMDIQDMKQKWFSLNNLWNILSGKEDVWKENVPLPNLWNRFQSGAEHLSVPFDNYGGNMGIQTTHTLRAAYKMRCMLARAMIEGPEHQTGSFEMSASRQQQFVLLSSLQEEGAGGLVSEKNWLVESLRGRARVNMASNIEFEEFGRTGQQVNSKFFRDIHPQEQRESVDGIPYYKTFPPTSEKAYEKDPEFTRPFKYKTDNSNLQMLVSSGTQLTQTMGFVLYPQRRNTTKNAISEMKHENGKKSRCDTVRADVFNDPTEFNTASPHGIYYGPLGFNTHHGKIGGTKKDWDAIKDIWQNSDWTSPVSVDHVPEVSLFSRAFRDCLMNKKPLIELAVCSTTLSTPSVPLNYFTTNFGDGICDPCRNIPHSFCLKTDSVDFFHSSSRHQPHVNVVSSSQSKPYRKREKDFTSRPHRMIGSLSPISEQVVRDTAIELWTEDDDDHRNFRKEVPRIQEHYLERAKRILMTESAGSWATASFALSDSWYLDGIDRRHKDPQHALKRLYPLSLNSYQEQRVDMNVTQEKWNVQKNDWKNMESVFGAREDGGALHNDIILRHTNQLQCRSGKSRNVDSEKFNYLQFNNRRNKRDGEKFVKISRRYGVGQKGATTIVLTSNPSQKLQVGFEVQISAALKSVVSPGTSVVNISSDRKTLTLSKPLLNDLTEKTSGTTTSTSSNSTTDVTGYHIERIRCPGLVDYSNRKRRSGDSSRRDTAPVKKKKTTSVSIINYVNSSSKQSTMAKV